METLFHATVKPMFGAANFPQGKSKNKLNFLRLRRKTFLNGGLEFFFAVEEEKAYLSIPVPFWVELARTIRNPRDSQAEWNGSLKGSGLDSGPFW